MISIPNISTMIRNGRHWLLADQLVVSGGSFITVILAARGLNIGDFGRLSFILLAQLLLLAIQNAFITGPYMVMPLEHRQRKDYLTSVLWLHGLLLLLLLSTGMAFYWVRAPWMGAWGWIMVLMMGYLSQDLLRKIFLTEGRALHAFAIDLLTNGLQLLLLWWLYTAGRLDLSSCLMVMGVTFIPSILLGLYWMDRTRASMSFVKGTALIHLQHGKWLLGTSLLQWWAGNSFTVGAGVLLGATAFGALRLAQNVFGVMNVLFQALENLVLPQAAGVSSQGRGPLRVYLRGVTRKSAVVVLPCLLLMALSARPLLLLAGGKEYASYYRVIPELSVLYFLIFYGYPIRIAIRVLHLNKAFFVGYLLSGTFSILAARVLIQVGGIEGVVGGLFINQLLMMCYWYIVLSKKKFYGDHTCGIGES